MALSIKQAALNDLNACKQAMVDAESRFRSAVDGLSGTPGDQERLEQEFTLVARAGLGALRDLKAILLRNQAFADWTKMDLQVQGGSLSALRQIYMARVNSLIHTSNDLYKKKKVQIGRPAGSASCE